MFLIELRKYLWIICSVLGFFVQAQANQCAVQIPEEQVLCGPQNIEIEASGNIYSLQWYDENFTKIDTGKILNRMVETAQKIYVINKQEIGNELIVNGDFEQGNVGFYSDYFESCTNPNMPQGAYCISNTTNQFHPAWSSCSDKSSGSGNMLVSDGAANANQKIWCQNVTVNPNTTYAFSTWVSTLISINPPIMQFTINGESIGEAFQSNDTPCEWEEFFQIWESGNETQAEICILNQNVNGMGNDFALDEISFKTACAHKDSLELSFAPEINVDLGADFEICAGENHSLKNIAHNNKNLSHNWSTGASSESIVINEPGNYTLELKDEYNCRKMDDIEVWDVGVPNSVLGEDTVVCFDITEQLDLYAGEAKTTIWQWNGRTVDSSKVLSIQTGGNYSVFLSNGENCSTSDEIFIDTLCVEALYFPNAFTPNADGRNDVFKAYGLDAYDFKLTVYSRWGDVVYESTSINEGWDGTIGNKKAPTGTYVFRCDYTVVDPNKGILVPKEKLGHLTLFR